MITFEENIRNENIKDIAKMLMTAARTAPKARGTDNLVLAVATDDSIAEIADKMRQLAVEREMPFFERDAENVMNSAAIVLFGMKISPLGLNCAACGYKTCGDKPKNVPCFFNANDMAQAGSDLACMFGFGNLPAVTDATLYYLQSFGLLFAIAFVGATPIVKKWGLRLGETKVGAVLEPILLLLLLLICTAYLVDGAFSPFLYFRF